MEESRVEWKTRERLTGTSFQYQRVGHCQKEVKEHEKRKRQEEKWEEARGQDRYLDSKADLEEKDSAAKEMTDCFCRGVGVKLSYKCALWAFCEQVWTFVDECFLPKAEQAVVQY